MRTPALVVLGNSSTRMRRRLVAAAERIAPRLGARTVVLSGWAGSAGPSEAEQMRALWRGSPDVDLVVEESAATTAQNAARTLPLLLARGVTDAVVVCAPVHLPRARWIFQSLYERHGISVQFRLARAVPTPGAIAWELGAFAVTGRQVRAAQNELERA